MPARLLTRHVPEWFPEQEPLLRAAIPRDVQRYFGNAAAEGIVSWLASAPAEKLVTVWNRIPYVESSDELLDPQWTLGVERLFVRDLFDAAFGRPLPCGLLLEPHWRSGNPTRKVLGDAVPWLTLLEGTDSLLTALRQEGWLLFRCQSEMKAKRLQAQVRSSVVRCLVLTSMNEGKGCASSSWRCPG